jgi:hypothetical protein
VVVAVVFDVSDLHARNVTRNESLCYEMVDVDIVCLTILAQAYTGISVTVVAGLEKRVGVDVHDLAVGAYGVVRKLLNPCPNLIFHLFPVLPTVLVEAVLREVPSGMGRIQVADSPVGVLCTTVLVPALRGVDLRFH